VIPFRMVPQKGLCGTGRSLVARVVAFASSFRVVPHGVQFAERNKSLIYKEFSFCVCRTPKGVHCLAAPPPRGLQFGIKFAKYWKAPMEESKLKPVNNSEDELMSIRKSIWKAIRSAVWKTIWLCSLGRR
jgi:hypothetical protein